jgi:DNA (cytosine-5)-methyltransferase 1
MRSICKTVAYCEIDQVCQKVLHANMCRGRIDKAPIFDDVTALSADQLRGMRPKMITAGFPCQDISVANPDGLGLKGKRSGLFKEVLRLVDALPSVQLVFLENSSRILKVGFKTLLKDMNHRGFEVRYSLVRASDVGALHKRLRWFCVCYKPRAHTLIRHIYNDKLMRFKWSRAMGLEKVMAIKDKKHKSALVARCGMLGNSVVPQSTIWAWNTLAESIKSNTGSIEAKNIVPFKDQLQMRLIFTDGSHTIKKKQWATPVHSVWHNYTLLTDRGSRLLSNQTFYFEGRRNRKHYNMYVANPLFVECLMGYPPNYTKI